MDVWILKTVDHYDNFTNVLGVFSTKEGADQYYKKCVDLDDKAAEEDGYHADWTYYITKYELDERV